VRADGALFLHAPDHVEPEFERIIAKTPRYAVVRKFGRHLAELVLRLDPRRRPAV
jgi:hypothetical protein